MPLPRPRDGEVRSKFIDRCMGDALMVREFGDRSQRRAVCASQWKGRHNMATNSAEHDTVWTAEYINKLPDSAFRYVESGGKKDEEGKTVPRALRHFPYRDATGKVVCNHVPVKCPKCGSTARTIYQSGLQTTYICAGCGYKLGTILFDPIGDLIDIGENGKGNYLELSANLAADSIVRKVVDGKDMLVGNVVMAVEGVMNGLLYTFDALNYSAPGWNGRPVIISHPERRGVPITANSPELLKTHVGNIYNAYGDAAGKKLKAKLYLDADKLNTSDEGRELIRRMDSHKVQEVSTGLFMTREGEGGVFGNDWYDAEAVNILPDHLAVLLDVTGASAVEDGAGFPRLNKQQQDSRVAVEHIRGIVVHEIDERNRTMEKEKMIKEILAANAGFSEADKDWLGERSDAELTGLHGKLIPNDADAAKAKAREEADDKAKVDKAKADADAKVQADADAAKAKAKAEADNKADKEDGSDEGDDKEQPVVNFKDVLASADDATRESIEQGRRLYDAKKDEVVAVIMANKDNKFTKEALAAMPFEQLEHIAQLAAPQPVYAGQLAAHAGGGGDEDQSTPPAMPPVDWENKNDNK